MFVHFFNTCFVHQILLMDLDLQSNSRSQMGMIISTSLSNIHLTPRDPNQKSLKAAKTRFLIPSKGEHRKEEDLSIYEYILDMFYFFYSNDAINKICKWQKNTIKRNNQLAAVQVHFKFICNIRPNFIFIF